LCVPRSGAAPFPPEAKKAQGAKLDNPGDLAWAGALGRQIQTVTVLHDHLPQNAVAIDEAVHLVQVAGVRFSAAKNCNVTAQIFWLNPGALEGSAGRESPSVRPKN
jgi:hypothetical protein